MSNIHTPSTRSGSAVSVSSTGATVATTVAQGEDRPKVSRDTTLGSALRQDTSWEGLTVFSADEIAVEQCSILLHEDTLAALQSGDASGRKDTKIAAERVDSGGVIRPRPISLACMSLLQHGHRVRLDVKVDNRIAYGKIALSHYDAVLLQVRPGGVVLCKIYEGEDRIIHQMELFPFSESLYACGNDLEVDYIFPYLREHPGLLLYEKQILMLTSSDHETALLVQVAKLHLEGVDGEQERGRPEEGLGVLSGRLGTELPILKLDEERSISFNHPYRFNVDDEESVILGDSE